MMLAGLVWSLLAMASQNSAAEGMLLIADQAFADRKVAEALDQYRKAAERAEKDGERSVRVEALAQVARCLSLQGKLDEGRPWLERAGAFASAEEPQGWSRLLGVRGIYQRESGDKAAAKATFEEMHRYCVEKKLHRRAIDAIHHLALVVPPAEQPAWALKGIEAAERLNDRKSLAVLWNNLGATYEDLRQHDKMLDAYLQAREHHHASGGPLQKMIADWAVGHGYRLNGRWADAETWLRKALPGAEELHAKAPRPETAEWVGWCKKDLGETLIARGEKPEGLELLKEARRSLVESGIEKHWPEGLKALDETIEKSR